MAERKFTRGLGRVGLAAQLREDVSLAVKATTSQARSIIPDPIDFEEYITNNKLIINSDSLRELLIYPADDITYSVIPRDVRTLNSYSSKLLEGDIENAFVKQCLTTYSQPITSLLFKYQQYSGSYCKLPRLPKVEDLKEQVYEIDTDIEQRDLAILSNGENVLKKGYILKAPDTSNEKIFSNFSAKTFKRRFACLRKEVDGTFLLEFHKDERKSETKGVLVMDFCSQISRAPRRGRCCFELQFSEGVRSVLLSAESEGDAEDWMDHLNRVVHADKPQLDLVRSERGLTPPSSNYGTLRGLEHSMNPQLMKYAHETDFSIAQARKEGRLQIFNCFPELQKQDCILSECDEEKESRVYSENFGIRFKIICENIKFRLQAPIDAADGPLSQLEPYFCRLSLYDLAKGRKISEDFHFDLNNSFTRDLLSKCRKNVRKNSQTSENFSTPHPLNLAGVPQEWLAYPKQAVMSVHEPGSEIYLVIRIEKVLQGSINQTSEAYLRNYDPKSTPKLQKSIRNCCQRLGDYRMPFGWCALKIFRNNGQLDTLSNFSPIFKSEDKKVNETEMLKLLTDFTKPEKLGKFTVIPGNVSVKVIPCHGDAIPNSVTTALEPVIPFPNPPTHEPTVEIQEFTSKHTDKVSPHVSFKNHLYVYPKSLNYDSQKTFSRARNIVCSVELRDSDETGEPLRVIYAPPGVGGSHASAGFTTVLHHSTFPEWGDEIKLALPPNLTQSHHLLFTFSHISIESTKSGKREDPVEIVGYSWLPLYNKGSFQIHNHILPVAAHLPQKYLSVEPLGLGRGFSGPEIRWVDSQKNVFKVSLSLISTVLSADKHLNNFFNTTAPLIPLDTDLNSSNISLPRNGIINDMELIKNLKALLALETHCIIEFFPTILNQLMLVLLCNVPDASINVTRVLIHIVHQIYDVGRDDVIYSYIKYVQNLASQGKKTIHGELCRSFIALLESGSLDPLVHNQILKHLKFFFSLISKSMALHLLTTERIKMTRNERFSNDFQTSVKNLLELISSHLVKKYKETPIESRAANTALAFFTKKCLSMMDRGYVFGLVKSYLSKFNTGDPIVLQSYKFNYLKIISSHEHFISLNLPVFNQTPAQIRKESFSNVEDVYLSNSFISQHFLVGALLIEVKSALGEIAEVQKIAILVLRDLLAKHAFDDRYLQASQQGRLSMLYFPLVSILMENVSRLCYPDKRKAPSLGLSLKKGSECRDSTRTRSSCRFRESFDTQSNFSLSSNYSAHSTSTLTSVNTRNSMLDPTKNLDSDMVDSSFLSIIAGPGGHGLPYSNPSPLSPSPLIPGRSNASIESANKTPSMVNSDQQDDLEFTDNSIISNSVSRHSKNLSVAFTGENGPPIRYDKLNPSEVKNLLLCFLYVMKNVPEDHLSAWWMTLTKEGLAGFFQLLTLCLHYFKYNGKRYIVRTRNPKRTSTLPNAVQKLTLNGRGSAPPENSTSNSNFRDNECWIEALQEANLATEAGTIVLDAICAFTVHCGDLVKGDECDDIVKEIFSLYMFFLQLGQSESLMKHLFAALRAFINNFSSSIFQGEPTICGSFCFEILKYCNSKLTNIRHEACAILYLLMRSNYEFTQYKDVNRIHLQVVISVSELLGEVNCLNNVRFQESLALINSYASSDKAMTNTGFVNEVRDLTKRIRTVLVATAQMREHERDPEMLCDLQHSLAASYAATPELRSTWLQAMVKHHLKNGDFSEAAFCQLHIAALIAEYLKHQGEYESGCQAFEIISMNIPNDENNLKIDTEINGSIVGADLKPKSVTECVFTVDILVENLEIARNLIERSERYELLGNLYRIIIPIYESKRNYPALVSCYKHLYDAYSKVVEVNASQKRFLGRYYRVAFYGVGFFEEESARSYVYKEPKVTSLAEISERLQTQYGEKFGKDAIKIIMDSNFVDQDKLDSRFAYIQVTHVQPYFTESERPNRLTEYEKHHNINEFIFETPFTLEGKPHGKLEDQWKRRVVVKTAYTFPYVKKRILITDMEVNEMSPIEVAIDEMEGRVKELKEILEKKPTDIKKLQLKLQGSISVQVNAGPLAYANTFLDVSRRRIYPAHQIMELKDVYRDFMMICKQALNLNSILITKDQYEYQMSMESNFSQLLTSLSGIFDEPLLVAQVQVDYMFKRTSQHYLSIISSPRGSSVV